MNQSMKSAGTHKPTGSKGREHINQSMKSAGTHKLAAGWKTWQPMANKCGKIASVQSRFVFVLHVIHPWAFGSLKFVSQEIRSKYLRQKLNSSTYPLQKPLLSHLAVKE